ncbi:unnamed protein product [Clavelina lepadiformis]|uniref:Protein-PII uridylyltransferase N-terminal domain-containing protein n=1 Tax=Clavelina lepadiformis TaxID=159417 RepID=A0ABP0F870_CLALP
MVEEPFQSKDPDLIRAEDKLAKKLHKNCNPAGKELNLKKSAKIFYKMGLLYKKRSPDKISLLRSAALFNAAILRNPEKHYDKHDLKHLCQKVLKLAKAQNLDANLQQISNEIAELAQQMRVETRSQLSELKNIPYDVTEEECKEIERKKITDVKRIQDMVSNKYTELMKHISVKCLEVMGPSPCQFAVVGMGSLARREITPYSDFEHIMLLEEGVQYKSNYGDVLHYFRWFSVLFQIIIINLKETIIPSMAIPTLNDVTKENGDWFFDAFTPRGISFDGLMPYACKFPLGRSEKTKNKPWTNELIQPVSRMLKYLDSDEDLKNGYHIGDIVTRTCFVFGNLKLYQQFAGKVSEKLHDSNAFNHTLLIKQLNEDLKKFDAFDSLYGLFVASKFNVKRVLYRSTSLFIAALGRIHKIDETSSFAIIKKLNDLKIIDDKTAHMFSYATAVSCQVRLSVYMKQNSQDDYVGEEELYLVFQNNIYNEVISTAGEKSVVDYFIIAYNLQNAIRSMNWLRNEPLRIIFRPSTKFLMLHLLRLFDRIITEWEGSLKKKAFHPLDEEDLYIRYYVANAYCEKRKYYKSLLMLDALEKEEKVCDLSIFAEIKTDKTWCMLSVGRFQEALLYAQESKEKILALNIPQSAKYYRLSRLCHMRGTCKTMLLQFDEGISEFEESEKHLNDIDEWPRKSLRRAHCFRNIAFCHYRLSDYDKALLTIHISLEICEKQRLPVHDKCECYHLIGLSYYEQANYKKALTYFEIELTKRLPFVTEETQDSDEYIRLVKRNIQFCKIKLEAKPKKEHLFNRLLYLFCLQYISINVPIVNHTVQFCLS